MVRATTSILLALFLGAAACSDTSDPLPPSTTSPVDTAPESPGGFKPSAL